jgi:hypothetical protein
MPREQAEWSRKQSKYEEEKIHAHQCCTYSSILNVNKGNDPFSTSYEHAQTWTLQQTMSNKHKRYQSVIENIHLTIPTSSGRTKLGTKDPLNTRHRIDREDIKLARDRSLSLISPQKRTVSSLRPSQTLRDSNAHQAKQPSSKTLTIRHITDADGETIMTSPSSNSSSSSVRPMRIIHNNGEFIIRI